MIKVKLHKEIKNFLNCYDKIYIGAEVYYLPIPIFKETIDGFQELNIKDIKSKIVLEHITRQSLNRLSKKTLGKVDYDLNIELDKRFPQWQDHGDGNVSEDLDYLDKREIFEQGVQWLLNTLNK